MRHIVFSSVALAALAFGCNSQSQESDKETPAANGELTQEAALSQTVGFMLHDQLAKFPAELDLDEVVVGIRLADQGGNAPMTQEQFMQEMIRIRTEKLAQEGTANLKIAEEFLKENGSKSGVITAEDGKLQYIVLQEGTGPEVIEEDSPTLHYEGSYVDGTVFDSSIQRGEPVTFSLGATIPGFRKGIVGMKEGERRRLFIHPELGYGAQGPLKPNALLIFEVEVIKIKQEESQQSTEVEGQTSEAYEL